MHPKIKAGVATFDQVFGNFCSLMEATQNEIFYKNFFDFFLLISLMTDHDNVFFNLMHVLFSI